MHFPVLVRDLWRVARRLFGSRRAIAALMLGVMALDCSDAILDQALTAMPASTPVAGGQAIARTDAREAEPNHVSTATRESQRAPTRESVPTPHAPCPCASAVPLTVPPELPHLAMRDIASRPEPGDFTMPHSPALELRLRPPLAFLG